MTLGCGVARVENLSGLTIDHERGIATGNRQESAQRGGTGVSDARVRGFCGTDRQKRSDRARQSGARPA